VLCPCAADITEAHPDFLQRLMTSLGYKAYLQRCVKLSSSLSDVRHSGSETIEPIPPPVAVVILTHGQKHTADGKTSYDPLPAIDNLAVLQAPNKRLCVFLIEAGIRDTTKETIRQNGYPPECLIEFPRGRVEAVTDRLAQRLREFEGRLRQSPLEFQDPGQEKGVLTFRRVTKRSHVYPNGFGVVELGWEIDAEALRGSKADCDGGHYRFEHTLALRSAVSPKSRATFEKPIKTRRPDSIASVFFSHEDRFCVVRFGKERTQIEVEEDLAASTDQKRALTVLVPKDSVEPCDTLSYGLIWAKRDMYTETEEYSGLQIKDHVTSVVQSVCFMRSATGKPWPFKWGPRLHRYGPYDNDLGYIDMEGIWTEESFISFDFTWQSQKAARGSSFVARWALAA